MLFDSFFNAIASLFDTQTDRDIADKNLEYQKDRNAIEDARYEDETAYNRAFAENVRDYDRMWQQTERNYNRNLQQQIFEREDTALERQFDSLSKLGINPLSQNLNGLQSGAIVSTPQPSQPVAPSLSSRGGQPLNDTYSPSSIFSKVASPILEAINAVDNINTQGVQRDSLRAQTNYQKLLNESQAIENQYKKAKLEESLKNLKADTENKEANTKGKNIDNSRNKRVDDFQNKTGLTDMNNGSFNTMPNLAYIGEQTATSLEKQKEGEFKGNPLSYTGEKLKDSFSTVGNAMADTFGKGAKIIFNSLKNRGSKIKKWLKHNSAPADYMRNEFGF